MKGDDKVAVNIDYQLAFEMAPVGLVLSSNRRIVDCNTHLCEMFGASREQLMGQSFLVLYPSVDEYERIGTANLFVMVEPLTGYRHVQVTERRTAVDYAWQLKWLADVCYPNATKIRLVQDNLNTHRLANLYLVFPPAEARRLAERFELHYTPTHGSWLNMAEIEIGIFERGCLGKRVSSFTVLQRRVAALETERNAARASIDWRFTTGEDRVTLTRLYPKLDQPVIADLSTT